MKSYMIVFWALNVGFGRAEVTLNYDPYSHNAMTRIENMISKETGYPYVCVTNIIPLKEETGNGTTDNLGTGGTNAVHDN